MFFKGGENDRFVKDLNIKQTIILEGLTQLSTLLSNKNKEVAKLQEQNKNNEIIIKELNQKIIVDKTNIDASTENIKVLEKKIKEETQEKDGLLTRIDQLQREALTGTNSNTDLSEQMTALSARIKESTASIKSLNEQLDTKKNEIQTLTSQIATKEALLVTKTDEITKCKSDIETKLKAANDIYNAEIAQKDTTIAQKEAIITENNKKLTEFQAKIDEQNAQMIEDTRQLGEIRSQIVAKDSEIGTMRTTATSSSDQNATALLEARSLLAVEKAELESKKSELMTKDTELSRINEQIAAKDAEIDRIKTAAASDNVALVEARRLLALEKTELEIKKAELITKNDAITAKEAELIKINGQIATKDAEIDRLTTATTSNNAALVEEKRLLAAEQKQLRENIAQKDTIITEKEAELTEIRAQIVAKNGEIDKMSSATTGDNAALVEARRQLAAKQTELTTKIEELAAKDREITAQKDQLKDINAQIVTKNGEISDKNTELEEEKAKCLRATLAALTAEEAKLTQQIEAKDVLIKEMEKLQAAAVANNTEQTRIQAELDAANLSLVKITAEYAKFKEEEPSKTEAKIHIAKEAAIAQTIERLNKERIQREAEAKRLEQEKSELEARERERLKQDAQLKEVALNSQNAKDMFSFLNQNQEKIQKNFNIQIDHYNLIFLKITDTYTKINMLEELSKDSNKYISILQNDYNYFYENLTELKDKYYSLNNNKIKQIEYINEMSDKMLIFVKFLMETDANIILEKLLKIVSNLSEKKYGSVRMIVSSAKNPKIIESIESNADYKFDSSNEILNVNNVYNPDKSPEKKFQINISNIKEFYDGYKIDAKDTNIETGESFKDMIELIKDGYAITLLSHGVSGSGKTYNLIGNTDHKGLVTNLINELKTSKEYMSYKSSKIEIQEIVECYVDFDSENTYQGAQIYETNDPNDPKNFSLEDRKTSKKNKLTVGGKGKLIILYDKNLINKEIGIQKKLLFEDTMVTNEMVKLKEFLIKPPQNSSTIVRINEITKKNVYLGSRVYNDMFINNKDINILDILTYINAYRANQNRILETVFNPASSRSHLVMRIQITIGNKIGNLIFIDLAGIENTYNIIEANYDNLKEYIIDSYPDKENFKSFKKSELKYGIESIFKGKRILKDDNAKHVIINPDSGNIAINLINNDLIDHIKTRFGTQFDKLKLNKPQELINKIRLFRLNTVLLLIQGMSFINPSIDVIKDFLSYKMVETQLTIEKNNKFKEYFSNTKKDLIIAPLLMYYNNLSEGKSSKFITILCVRKDFADINKINVSFPMHKIERRDYILNKPTIIGDIPTTATTGNYENKYIRGGIENNYIEMFSMIFVIFLIILIIILIILIIYINILPLEWLDILLI